MFCCAWEWGCAICLMQLYRWLQHAAPLSIAEEVSCNLSVIAISIQPYSAKPCSRRVNITDSSHGTSSKTQGSMNHRCTNASWDSWHVCRNYWPYCTKQLPSCVEESVSNVAGLILPSILKSAVQKRREGWYIISCEHDVIDKRQNKLTFKVLFNQPTTCSSLGVYDSCSTLTIIFPIATLLTWDYVPDCPHLSVLKAKNMWAGALEWGYGYPWQLLQKIWGSIVFVMWCTIACDPIHMTWQAGLIMHSLCWIPYLCSWWVNVAISIRFQFQGGDIMAWIVTVREQLSFIMSFQHIGYEMLQWLWRQSSWTIWVEVLKYRKQRWLAIWLD